MAGYGGFALPDVLTFRDGSKVTTQEQFRARREETDYFELEVDRSYQSEGVGFHVHSGGHKMDTNDWRHYIAY